MAKDDDKPVTQGQYKADQTRLIDGLKEDLAKHRGAIGEQIEHGYSEAVARFHERLLELEKRQGDLEAAATAPSDAGARPAQDSNVAKAARKRGAAVVQSGTTVFFRPHDGSGPKEGWPAILCDARFQREGFPAVYGLWVIEPRRSRWEENIKEGEGAGTFTVR